MEEERLFPAVEGSPQGGVISPLLANIALHGMEQAIHQAFPTKSRKINGVPIRQTTPHLVRYADDFVILHEDVAVVEQCKGLMSDWLAPVDLELKASKTCITHTLFIHQG